MEIKVKPICPGSDRHLHHQWAQLVRHRVGASRPESIRGASKAKPRAVIGGADMVYTGTFDMSRVIAINQLRGSDEPEWREAIF